MDVWSTKARAMDLDTVVMGDKWSVRQASQDDEVRIGRLMGEARRTLLHFDNSGLREALAREPFLLGEDAGRLAGFLAWAVRRPQQGDLVAAGLADDVAVLHWLDQLLPPSVVYLRQVGTAALSYIGSAPWLLDPLQERGFHLLSHIVSYEKSGWQIPYAGSQAVSVRPVQPADLAALVAVDEKSFHPRWRNSPATLSQWRDALPFFVVAATGDGPVGYCYCSIGETGQGHLIRVAVHPAWQGLGIGARLMGEAVHFFQKAGARVITLNTQQENERAQRLYQRFGFRSVGREATALWLNL